MKHPLANQAKTALRAARPSLTILAWFARSLYVSILFLLPLQSYAAVLITEVIYDLPGSDNGREWIEITNKGTEVIDISKFKFLEGRVKHKLVLSQGSWLLAAGDSAVIANEPLTFLSEHTGFTKSIYKSSFSLSNTGETLALINASGNVESSFAYTAPTTPTKSKITKTTATKVAKPEVALSQIATPALVSPSTKVQEDISIPMTLWVLGLLAIIGLGISGVVFTRLNNTKGLVTTGKIEEFEIE